MLAVIDVGKGREVPQTRIDLSSVRLEGSGEVPVLRGKGSEVDNTDVEMPRLSLYSLSSSQSSTAE